MGWSGRHLHKSWSQYLRESDRSHKGAGAYEPSGAFALIVDGAAETRGMLEMVNAGELAEHVSGAQRVGSLQTPSFLKYPSTIRV